MIRPLLMKPPFRGMGTCRFLLSLDCYSSSSPTVRTAPAALPFQQRKRRNLSSLSEEYPLFMKSTRYPTVTSTSKTLGTPPEQITTNDNNDRDVTIVPALFHSGPSLQLGIGRVAVHTHSSVVAKAGSTTILCTVARAPLEESDQLQTGESSFLTVEYRQRAAGVGQIPGNRLRSDQGRTMSSSEVLAARILDRSLRPLLKQDNEGDAAPAQYHVLAAVHAIDLWSPSRTGHAIATALNAASAALVDQLTEPVAGTVLAVMSDGSIVQDPGPETRQPIQIQPPESSETPSDPIILEPYCVGELFYSGTRTHTIMMEWTSIHDSLPEEQWPALLELAAAAIQPILDTIEELHKLHQQRTELTEPVDIPDGFVSKDDALALNAQLRSSLGLPPLDTEDDTSVEVNGDSSVPQRPLPKDLLPAALSYCRKAMGETPIHSLYGVRVIGIPIQKDTSLQSVAIHKNDKEILSKVHRGRRETIINQEIYRLVDQFITTEAGLTLSSSEEKDETSIVMPESERRWLQQKVGYYLLQHGLWETSWRFGTRSDGRRHIHVGQGWKTVRPLRISLPALPDSVHGSAVFARGDTQVLCTVTLGAPKEGQSILDPYQPLSNPQLLGSEATNNPSTKSGSDFDNLPVGSLRFLRTQEALESDLNSRKSLADKERTGDSGNLAEVKRAFLQYDFPAYSTGEVPKRGGMDRRSIGHGALAERAILPILPDAHIFPYAIRITSEVTDSNGSSSMASVCGATLALRDAGVPLKASVAGVSVGLAVCNEDILDPESISNESKSSSDDKKFSLLLDITGTEDHYGAMDFKIAGTRKGVTAIQLDVKQPLPISILIEALKLAKAGRIEILEMMDKRCLTTFDGALSRLEPKESAPRVEVVRFDPQRKRDLVGPGGIVLRQLEDRYGVALDLTQEGQCLIFGANRAMVEKAKITVMDLVADVLEGETYIGTVIEIKDFGVIIELLRNKEGILHVSEISADPDEARRHPEGNLGFVRQQLRVGQQIEVLCIGVDPVQGTVKLSRKALLEKKKQVSSEFVTVP